MSFVPLILALGLAQASEHRIQGVIRSADGEFVAGANVFVAETANGVLSGKAGEFELRVRSSAVTVIVTVIGYRPYRRHITLPHASALIIELEREVVAVDPLTVRAGSYEISDQRGASLSSLEVVQIPGSRGDVTRAFQTLPGVQTVDEGTGLFVRGGAASETRIVLNGAAILTPQRLETPTGSVSPTVDPFLLEGMFFSTGGFSVRHGNALSAVADLQTVGMPARQRSTAHVSLASISGRSSVPIGRSTGIHATGSLSNTRLMFDLNGSTRTYTDPPRGHTVSGSAVLKYRPSAELKVFAIRQATDLGVVVEDAALRDPYRISNRTHIAVASWKDSFDNAGASASASYSETNRSEQLGALDVDVAQNAVQLSGEFRRQLGNAAVRAGSDFEHIGAQYQGLLPASRSDRGAGAPTRSVDANSEGARHGLFTEVDIPLGRALRITPGARTDYSSLTRHRTIDPRISISAAPSDVTTVVASAGVYHQTADALMLALADQQLPSARAHQFILGLQTGPETDLLRIEVYHKRYRDLVQLTREHVAVANGHGYATGADVFKRLRLPGGLDGRVVYSFSDSRRTDPHTLALARAEFDVTHSLFGMFQRQWLERWRAGVSYRGATGRPFTPVNTAVFDSARAQWMPVYGAPYSERLPNFHRIDVSASLLHWFTQTTLGVFYVSLSNVLDSRNIQTYSYSDDYADRHEVPAQSKRSVFFGASLTF